MTPVRPLRPVVLVALVWLGLFALLYTAGETAGIWPELPPGAFAGAEVVAGFAGLAVLIVVLLRRGRPRGGN